MQVPYQPLFHRVKIPLPCFLQYYFSVEKLCPSENSGNTSSNSVKKAKKEKKVGSQLQQSSLRDLVFMSHLHRCFSLLCCFQGDSGADNTQRGFRGQKGEIGPMVTFLCCFVLFSGFYTRMGQRKGEKRMLPKRCKFLKLIVPCQMEYFLPLENVVGLQPKLSLGRCHFSRCFV